MPKRSKIDRHAHLLGVETDSAIARKARVTSEAVRIYRVRRGIPSVAQARRIADDGSPTTAAVEATEKTPAIRPSGIVVEVAGEQVEAATRAPFRRGGKPSPIDEFSYMLGKATDSSIAKMAGVSKAAVLQYRKRRKIARFDGTTSDSSGRKPRAGKGRSTAATPKGPAATQPAKTRTPGKPLSEAPTTRDTRTDKPTPVRRDAPAPRVSFLVDLRIGDEVKQFVAVGTDIADAAAAAARGADGRGEVLRIARHLDVLG